LGNLADNKTIEIKGEEGLKKDDRGLVNKQIIVDKEQLIKLDLYVFK
jgi:hypothetical protein